MELRQLQYFDAIARTGGFRTAADDLNVSPATLSEQIKYLEQELGVRLFVRGSRNVTLTEAGVALRQRAERALSELRTAREELLDFARLERGQLIVGTLPGMGTFWLPTFLAAFIRTYPHVNLRLVERWSTQLFRLLDSGDLHVACVLLPGNDYQPPAGITIRRYYTGKLAVVVAPNHRLARAKNVTLEDLANEPLVLTSPDEAPRTIVERAFHARGLDPTVVFEANDPTTLVRLAGEGIGVGITGAQIGRAHPEAVATVPLERGDLRYDGAIAWPEHGPHTKALSRFVDFLLTWWNTTTAESGGRSAPTLAVR